MVQLCSTVCSGGMVVKILKKLQELYSFTVYILRTFKRP